MANNLAQPSDLLLRFDSNLLGQVVNDQGQQQTSTALLTNAALHAALDDAAGTVYAALYVAYKYTAAELSTLDSPSTSLLTRLVCDLAIVMLCQRRGYSYDDKYPMVGLSLEMIQQLRNGERVLNLAGNESAGLSASVHPSICLQERIGLVTADYHMFPMRGAGWRY